MNKCEGCDLYINGHCAKYTKNSKAEPSTREWLYEDLDITELEFISEYRMCRKSSIFGNDYVGVTLDDIERIKNGEILHISGEYGMFIGLVEEKGENKNGNERMG